MFIPAREPSRNRTIEHFADTFDMRFFCQERLSDVQQLTERAGAFARFDTAQHDYSATRRPVSDQARAARHLRSPSSPPAGPSEARSSSIASSAQTASSGSSERDPGAQRQRYQYAPPGSTSRSLPTNTACRSATTCEPLTTA